MNLTEFKKSYSSTRPHLLLIGNPVGHSLSPIMHNAAADYYNFELQYYAVQVKSNEWPLLGSYLNNDLLKGVNITIPFKEMMFDYVDEVDQSCRKIGAVNTIVKQPHVLKAYNTDSYGFCAPLDAYKAEIEEQPAIIFGTGGAARAVVHGLMDYGASIIWVVSRNPTREKNKLWPEAVRVISYDEWPEHAQETALIVNATPLGMEPKEGESPVEDALKSHLAHKICYDIVYNPQHTRFLQQAETVDGRTIGGLEMLVHQGSRSFELWTGKSFPIAHVKKMLNEHLRHEY